MAQAGGHAGTPHAHLGGGVRNLRCPAPGRLRRGPGASEVLQARYAIEQQDLFGPEDEERYGEDIEGPLNILLVGVDTRPSRPHEPARADAIILVHVSAELDRGYLISLPRDALVEIPPVPETGYLGGQDRLNAAMFHGSRQQEGEELPDLARGFRLMHRPCATSPAWSTSTPGR